MAVPNNKKNIEDVAFIKFKKKLQRYLNSYQVKKVERAYLFAKEGSVNIDAYYTLFENQVIVNRETQGTLSFDNLEGNSNSKVLQMDISYNLAEGFDVKGSYKMQEVIATFDGEEKFVPFVPKD